MREISAWPCLAVAYLNRFTFLAHLCILCTRPGGLPFTITIKDKQNDTLPEWNDVVKCFTPEREGKILRGFPDKQGGNTFKTEREQGVMS